MTIIKHEDFVQSIADALQYISYYHPKDFIQALHEAYKKEQSPSAKEAIAQILVNSRLCAEGKRPICQDTGIVTAFIKVGMKVQWQGDGNASVADLVNAGTRQAYTNPDNILRPSILSDPVGRRGNTGDNTPAVVHVELVAGDKVEVEIAAKGGGSEAKSRLVMLNPFDSIVDWVLDILPTMGAGWCPPGILGIGIGGTAEKAMLLAKQACMETIDIQQLIQRGASNVVEALRLELYDKVNALGIGAQGLGGLTTVLDIKIRDFPTHAANKPVAMIPNCAATRHVRFTLDGSGPVELMPPKLEDWPKIAWNVGEKVPRINLDTLTVEQISTWQSGQNLLLSGTLLTARDAAHKRLVQLLERGDPLPKQVNFTNKFIYYVGPVAPVRDEIVGPAGPTTATRMDKFTETMLDKTSLLGMIGKGERGAATVEAIKKHRTVYLIAIGGAAYLVSRAIKKSRVLAFPELGMEAIHEFVVADMPVTVAIDSRGSSIHATAPKIWQQRIGKIPLRVENIK